MAGSTARRPAPKKPAANGRAPKKAAEAAIAELTDTPRLGVFRGITLTLPAKLPATFALDMAAVQASESKNDLGPIYTLIVGSVGPQQWAKVRDKIAADGDSTDAIGDILNELLAAITDPYNVEPGE